MALGEGAKCRVGVTRLLGGMVLRGGRGVADRCGAEATELGPA